MIAVINIQNNPGDLKDWLGTNTMAPQRKNYLSFNEVREFARSLKLQGKEEWYKYVKEKGLPDGIPRRPDVMYRKQGWNGWRDFIGTDFLPFHEAKKYAISLGLKYIREWFKHARGKGLPEGIPIHPEKVYKDEGWKGWDDFLGIVRKVFEPLPFHEAKKYAISLGLTSSTEWFKHAKKNGLPEGIPVSPEKI